MTKHILLISILFLVISYSKEIKTIDISKIQIRNEIFYEINVEKPFTGKIVSFFSNNVKNMEIPIRKGKKHGKQIVWYENEQKKSETNFKNGKLEGKQIEWHENGQKKSETNFKNEKPEGKQIEWHENGQKKLEGNSKNGKLEGTVTSWYKNGQKESEINSKNGKPEGKFIGWYKNGQKKLEGNSKNGKPEGKFIGWYKNGQKKLEGNSKNGKPYGKLIEWHENGKLKNKKINCSNGMCNIPAGDFMMGCNKELGENCKRDEKPYHKVYLDAFKMDQYEVTVAQFKKCVNARRCSQKNFKTNKYKDGGSMSLLYLSEKKKYNNYINNRSNHPMNFVSWYGANEYCHYAGKRLPTEAEWEKAARGTDGRVYPWGNKEANCNYAVMDTTFPGKKGKNGCGKSHSWKVGSKSLGRSRYGLYDMAGNVWEWVSDYHNERYYKKSSYKNPKGAFSGKERVFRGGSWVNTNFNLLTFKRGSANPTNTLHSLGFRCAKSY